MVPRYIGQVEIDRTFPEYDWDEWKVESHYVDIDPVRFERLCQLSFNANLAFSTACGWWIAERFARLEPTGEAAEFLALSGASTYGAAAYEYFELDDDKWRGPVRGPQAVMITILIDALFCLAEDPEPATRTGYLHRLANHVIRPDGLFDRWFDAALDRLLLHHRRPQARGQRSIIEMISETEWGAAVSQQAFDLGRSYLPEDDARYLALEVSHISQRNRFLPEP